MAGTVRPRLTAREGRRFAFTVGAAFLVLALLLWWRATRGHAPAPMAAYPLLGLGVLLFAAGAIVPTRLAPVQRAWMGLAHAISRITTPIFMAVVYFIVIAPIGLLMRAVGHNPLRRTAVDGSFWVVRSDSEQRTDIERQF